MSLLQALATTKDGMDAQIDFYRHHNNSVHVLGSVSVLTVSVKVKNHHQTAHAPAIYFSWRLKETVANGTRLPAVTLPTLKSTLARVNRSDDDSMETCARVVQLVQKTLRRNREVTELCLKAKSHCYAL